MVARQLFEDLGWSDILDLGPLRTARGVEMWLPLWIGIAGVAGTAQLNIKVVRQ